MRHITHTGAARIQLFQLTVDHVLAYLCIVSYSKDFSFVGKFWENDNRTFNERQSR